MQTQIELKVPRLRFPEFKDEWEEKSLSEITRRIGDGIHTTPKYSTNGEYYFINGNNLINGKIVLPDSTKRANLSEFLTYKRNLDKTTILVSLNGTVGNVSTYNNERVFLGKSVCYLNLKDGIDRKFVFYKLETQNTQKHFISEVSGTTIKNLSLKSISNTKVCLPLIKEQQKIATFLSKVDEWIGNLKEQKESLEKYKKGMMQKIFSQEIRFKDANGKEFPKWEAGILGEIISILTDYTANGSFAALRENVEYYSEKNYAVLIRTTDLEKDIFVPQRFTDELGYNFLKKTSLYGGELILSNVGNTGKVYRVPFFNAKMTLAPNTYLLKFHNSVSEVYVYQWMLTDSFVNKIGSIVAGGGLKAINKSTLRSVEINFPCKIEQQKIADFLTSIDKVIESKQEQITQATNWKKGLMQRMFI